MASKVEQLEARVTHLEQELRQLRAQVVAKEKTPWYRQIVGAFAGDSVYAEITRLGSRFASPNAGGDAECLSSLTTTMLPPGE